MTTLDEPTETDKRTLFFQKKKKGKVAVVNTPDPALEHLVADTHAHLDMLESAPLALARCGLFGIGFVCTIADVCETAEVNYTHLSEWQQEARGLLNEISPDMSRETPHVRIAVGCHPHNAKDFAGEPEVLLKKLLSHHLTCAIGEVGLDYHYDHSPRAVQQEVFRKHIELAHSTGLPLLLHLREAHEDAYKILEEEGFPVSGMLLHCFNKDWDTLLPWLDKGCSVALGGAVTFKKSEETREALLRIPDTVLMTETDAPYMTPEPMRSSACEPAHVIFTAAKIAEVKGYEPGTKRKELLVQMYDNARTLLDRDLTAWQLKEHERGV